MIVRSLDGLAAPARPFSLATSSIATSIGGPYPATYARIWKSQPWVRTAVDFLARGIAGLPLHVLRRESDTDRTRLTDHGLAAWVAAPNRAQTRFKFFEELVQDLGTYGTAIRIKVRPRTGPELETVRVPPEAVEVIGDWFPEAYRIQLRDRRITLRASDVFAVGFWDPENPLGSTSPIETLRQVLAEDSARGEYRENFWRRGAKPSAVIEQEGRGLSPEQITEWQSEWARLYAGAKRAGGVPLLEPGMKWKETGYSAVDSDLNADRKLTREEVGAAYHVPAPFLGLLDDATFSNVENLHAVLYEDVLGPWLLWIKEEIERQILPEFVDVDRVYCQFITAARLAGSFDKQADAIEKLTGRPVLTANEGRARLDLPRMPQPDADQLWLQPGTPGARGPAPARKE